MGPSIIVETNPAVIISNLLIMPQVVEISLLLHHSYVMSDNVQSYYHLT